MLPLFLSSDMHYLKLVYSKNIKISQRYLFSGYLEIRKIKRKSFKFEQRPVIQFFVAEKCKLCEIYRRIRDVYGEAYFSKNIFRNRLNMGFSLWDWVEKAVYGVEAHWFFRKEKNSWHIGQYRRLCWQSLEVWKDSSQLISLKKVQL